MKNVLRLFCVAASLSLSLAACSTTGSSVSSGANLQPANQPARTHRLTGADISVPKMHMFVGKTNTMLAEYFGEPSLVRKETGAEIHQFTAQTPFGSCVILAFLYEERGSATRVRHMSVREDEREAAEPIHCLREIAFAWRNANASRDLSR